MATSSVTLSALVVDDDALLRLMHTRLLEHEGWLVKAVVNGREAVELFREGEHFDLVLMDKEMPVLDGVNATAELRAMGAKCHIVGVTSCTDASDVESFLRAGLDAIQGKPLDQVKLHRILHDFHEKRNGKGNA
ncbi:hypothetical protein Drorol1_Dr00025061 [Drosera rotundifolia]